MPLPTPDAAPQRYVCEPDRRCTVCGALAAEQHVEHDFLLAADAPVFFLRPQPVAISARRAAVLEFTLGRNSRELLPSVQADQLLRLNDETFLAIFDHGESLFAAGDCIADGPKVIAYLKSLLDFDRIMEMCFVSDRGGQLDAVGKAPSASSSSGASSSASASTPTSGTS